MKRKLGSWREKQSANERKKAMFADILEDAPPSALLVKTDKAEKKRKSKKKTDDNEDANYLEGGSDIDEIFGASAKRSKRTDKSADSKLKEALPKNARPTAGKSKDIDEDVLSAIKGIYSS